MYFNIYVRESNLCNLCLFFVMENGNILRKYKNELFWN